MKAVLPSSAIAAVLDARDRYRLATQARLPFGPTLLRTRKALDVAAILRDTEIAATWSVDHSEIGALFGHDDRFGGVNPGDRRALYHLIRALQPRRVLEVGTHIGASTLYIARALRANGTPGSVVTVDITDVNDLERGAWRAVGQRMSPRAFAQQLDCADRIEFVVSKAMDFLEFAGPSCDLIFLDGDHSAQAVYCEVSKSLTALTPAGVILLHDFYPDGKALYPQDGPIRGPYRAMARIAREEPRVVVQPLGMLPWDTKQGTRATSLALVLQR